MKIKKFLFISLGVLSASLGIVGIFIPLLPTTPFLLLAAFLFLNSSEKLYNWLIHHKIFGRYIYNYLKYKAVTCRLKIITIITLWSTITISAVLIKSIYIAIFLALVGIGVSIHIVSLKTFKKSESKQLHDPDNNQD